MSTATELGLVRELLEKDLKYVCEKVDKIDKHLEKLNGQVSENTEFRKRFKWTASMIVTLASVVSFCVMLLGFKLQWFGR